MSNIEYEAKIYDVDPADIAGKLAKLDAKEVGSYNFRRYVFDTIPAKPDRWVRLRSDGKQATLTVKEITADTIDGTHEWEVEVSDMETTLEILAKIGIKPRGYQENKRQEYDLELLLQAARLAPSSYGMEQWNIIVAQDAKLRAQLKKASSIVNGSRFDASHILVFTAKTASGFDKHMTHMLRDVKGANVVTAAAMKAGWKHWAKTDFKIYDTPDGLHQWAARQAYIALGFVMLAAAERGIDSCAIEGFSIDKVVAVLESFKLINRDNDLPVVMLALGYRADESTHPRTRREMDEIVTWY